MKAFLRFALLLLLATGMAAGSGPSAPSTGFNYFHFTAPLTAVAVQIDAVPGTLHTITINTGGNAIEVADIASGCSTTSSPTIAVVTAAGSFPATLTYDLNFSNGLCVFTPSSSNQLDVTITYK